MEERDAKGLDGAGGQPRTGSRFWKRERARNFGLFKSSTEHRSTAGGRGRNLLAWFHLLLCNCPPTCPARAGAQVRWIIRGRTREGGRGSTQALLCIYTSRESAIFDNGCLFATTSNHCPGQNLGEQANRIPRSTGMWETCSGIRRARGGGCRQTLGAAR